MMWMLEPTTKPSLHSQLSLNFLKINLRCNRFHYGIFIILCFGLSSFTLLPHLLSAPNLLPQEVHVTCIQLFSVILVFHFLLNLSPLIRFSVLMKLYQHSLSHGDMYFRLKFKYLMKATPKILYEFV